MKNRFWSLLACCAFATSFAHAQESSAPSSPDSSSPESSAPKKKEKVTKLDGTSFFGIVTITDDYTIKISNDSGIMKIPLALLGEGDFKKYTGGKDRSQDGKLWSERKDALEDQKEKNDSEGDSGKNDKKKSATDNSAIEIQLGEISVFQPVISVYESAFGKPGSQVSKSEDGEKSEKEGEEKDDSTASSAKNSDVKLFSAPGSPFNVPGGGIAQPILSTGGALIQSAGNLAPVPSVPGAP